MPKMLLRKNLSYYEHYANDGLELARDRNRNRESEDRYLSQSHLYIINLAKFVLLLVSELRQPVHPITTCPHCQLFELQTGALPDFCPDCGREEIGND